MTTPRRLRWSAPSPPRPKHPYRDTFIVYVCLAAIVVLIGWATGTGFAKSLIIAAVFFAIAASWTTYHVYAKRRAERRRAHAEGERLIS